MREQPRFQYEGRATVDGEVVTFVFEAENRALALDHFGYWLSVAYPDAKVSVIQALSRRSGTEA